MSSEDVLLNDLWNVYFHDPSDSNWTSTSYVRLGDIASVDDYWSHASCWNNNITKGMFFVMRDGIFPCWDDAENIDGGCLSIKILKDVMPEFWQECTMRLVGETLVKDEYRDKFWNIVNGISTSPKKHFCIIKIWLRSTTFTDINCFDIPCKNHGDIIYKSNRDNIENDNIKKL